MTEESSGSWVDGASAEAPNRTEFTGDGSLPVPEAAGEEDTSPVLPDLSGWTPHPSERRDFLNRIRAFPPEVAGWRRSLLERLRTDPGRFRLASGLDARNWPAGWTPTSPICESWPRSWPCCTAHPIWATGPTRPTSWSTSSCRARPGRTRTRKVTSCSSLRFTSWDEILEVLRKEAERLVYSGGLVSKKTDSLIGAMTRLRETFGRCSLEPARDWPDDRRVPARFARDRPESPDRSVPRPSTHRPGAADESGHGGADRGSGMWRGPLDPSAPA